MNHVKQRVAAVVLVMALVVSGCAGADRTELSVGADSITREELQTYASVLQRIEPTSIFPADAARSWSRVWLIDAAFAQTIGEERPELSSERRLDSEQQLQQWVEAGQIGSVTPSTPGYDFLVRRAWLQSEPLTGDPVIQESVIALLQDDVEVAGRLGRWDPATLQVVPAG